MVREEREREGAKERDGEMCAGPFGENLMPFFVYYHFHVRSVNLFKFELPPLSLLSTAPASLPTSPLLLSTTNYPLEYLNSYLKL